MIEHLHSMSLNKTHIYEQKNTRNKFKLDVKSEQKKIEKMNLKSLHFVQLIEYKIDHLLAPTLSTQLSAFFRYIIR